MEKDELLMDIAKLLVKIGALRFGVFTLTSGKKSPYYIDLRLVPSYPGAFRSVIEAYKRVLKGLKFDAIVGIPTGSMPYASVLSYELKKPMIYVRKDERLHGTMKRVEGWLNPGWRCLIVDDLVTTGSSILNAARSVRAEGGIVKDAVVLIDREEGGREALKRDGIRLHSFSKISELAKILYEMNVLEEDGYRAIIAQVKK